MKAINRDPRGFCRSSNMKLRRGGYILPLWAGPDFDGFVMCPRCFGPAKLPAIPKFVLNMPKGFAFCSSKCAQVPVPKTDPHDPNGYPVIPALKNYFYRAMRKVKEQESGTTSVGGLYLTDAERNALDEYEIRTRCKCLGHLHRYGLSDYEWTSINTRRANWRRHIPVMKGILCAERASMIGPRQRFDIARAWGPRPREMPFTYWAQTGMWLALMAPRGGDIAGLIYPSDGWPDDHVVWPFGGRESVLKIDREAKPKKIVELTDEEQMERMAEDLARYA